MQSLIGGVLVVLGLIVARGFLTMSEFALDSARTSRLKGRASRGDRGAAAALRLGEDPKGFSTTVQAGITLLSVLAGVFGGATLEPELCRGIGQDGPLAPYRDAIGIVVVALGISVAMLVLGEFVPKRVALHWPERIAGLVARPIRALATATKPFVGGLSAATDSALRAVGIRAKPELPVTEEEIQVLMREGTKAGVFEEAEREMVKRVLRFGDRRARALMTPRNEVVWIDVTDTPEELREVVDSPHSRFPVCDQSLDNLLGIVHVEDLLGQGQNAEPFRFKGRLTLPLFLYEGTHGLKILEMFKTSATPQPPVVLDEYGTVEGLLTLTDILQAIVGDMPESAEDEQPPSVRQPDGSWLLDGRMPLDEFRDLFEQTSIPEGDFHTLAGFVVAQLGHIPRVQEGLDYGGLHFEVVEMDGNRVDRIQVKAGKAGGREA